MHGQRGPLVRTQPVDPLHLRLETGALQPGDKRLVFDLIASPARVWTRRVTNTSACAVVTPKRLTEATEISARARRRSSKRLALSPLFVCPTAYGVSADGQSKAP